MSNQGKPIVFLLKTLKEKHVESTIKEGRFCFSHPSVFNKWEGDDTARYDRWDCHSAEDATNIVVAPIIRDDEEAVEYGEVIHLAKKARIHLQTNDVKHTPICCFRYVERDGLIFNSDNSIDFSLGETVDRIKKEFGHDSFLLINATLFLERLRKKYICMDGGVVYHDTLNDYDFDVDTKIKKTVEQLFRKDKIYEWQKEYRIALQPSNDNPTFVELGSIEDIAISGKIDDLKGIIRLRK